MAEKALFFAEQAATNGAYDLQCSLLNNAARAFSISNDATRANETKIKAAEALLQKAELFEKSGQTMVASHWLNQAITAFQQCKGQQQRIIELQPKLITLNKALLKEMKLFSIPYDVTDMADKAIMAVQHP